MCDSSDVLGSDWSWATGEPNSIDETEEDTGPGGIPLLQTANATLDSVYYFRWRTLRSHIHPTADPAYPYVLTEFSPNVGWAGKYNTIVSAGHSLLFESWSRLFTFFLPIFCTISRSFYSSPAAVASAELCCRTSYGRGWLAQKFNGCSFLHELVDILRCSTQLLLLAWNCAAPQFWPYWRPLTSKVGAPCVQGTVLPVCCGQATDWRVKFRCS